MITFVLGGNKSGKSSYALRSLLAAPGPRLFLPTGKARDLAFREQIMDHKRERPADMHVLEAGADLPEALDQATNGFGSVLADSLDFWLFSCIVEKLQDESTATLLATLSKWSGPELFLVSCEIGLGPLPASGATRRFTRALG
ncbi:MAG: bifunctional adenosylcobinamide kinase/adenosylcobinamide-phosphate guanylyltransferase, partial [Desulfovibrionaceae bacterium]